MSVTCGMICLCLFFIKLAGVKFEKGIYLGRIYTKTRLHRSCAVRFHFFGEKPKLRRLQRVSYMLCKCQDN